MVVLSGCQNRTRNECTMRLNLLTYRLLKWQMYLKIIIQVKIPSNPFETPERYEIWIKEKGNVQQDYVKQNFKKLFF